MTVWLCDYTTCHSLGFYLIWVLSQCKQKKSAACDTVARCRQIFPVSMPACCSTFTLPVSRWQEVKVRGIFADSRGRGPPWGGAARRGSGEQTPRREGATLCSEHWATYASCSRMSRGWNSFVWWSVSPRRSEVCSVVIKEMETRWRGKKKDGEKIPQDVTAIGRSVGWVVFLFSIFNFL